MITAVLVSVLIWATAWLVPGFTAWWLTRTINWALARWRRDDLMAVAEAAPCCAAGHLHPARERLVTPAGPCGCMWLTEAGGAAYLPCGPHSLATPDFAEWQREFDRQNGAGR